MVLLSYQKPRKSNFCFQLGSLHTIEIISELIKSGHTSGLIALKVSKENTHNRYTKNVYLCPHACIIKNKQWDLIKLLMIMSLCFPSSL